MTNDSTPLRRVEGWHGWERSYPDPCHGSSSASTSLAAGEDDGGKRGCLEGYLGENEQGCEEHEPELGPIGANSELYCHGHRNGNPKRVHQVGPGHGVPPQWTSQAERWTARWMLDVGHVQNLGSVSEHAIGEVLNNAGIGDGDATLQSFASFRRTKMPRRVRAAAIISEPMPGDLEHTVVPSGLAFREELAPIPIGPPIH